MIKEEEAIINILLNERIINEEQLDKAKTEKEESGKSLARILIDQGFVDEETLMSVFAKKRGMPFVELSNYPVDISTVAMVPEGLARRYLILPIGFDKNGELIVAVTDPDNVFALDDIRILTGCEIKPVITTESDLLMAIKRYYKMEEISGIGDEAEEEELSGVREVAEEAPITKLVNLVLARAVGDRASDVHIEPQEKDIRVRFRIDGVLHEFMRSPKRVQAAILSRLKIMANMDIAEQRKPQDGRTTLIIDNKVVDFRVATLPTVYGERVVLRILKKEGILIELEKLGFLSKTLKRFESSFTKPYGAILVTGPTGSGKSTTLYATLNVLNSNEKNIITVEDPVEYRLDGLNQVQINPRAGLTFASGLRSILRHDPDIIMVGEIRDHETALIAIESALTGHLVLSTLHTNDAPSAITRLTEMGIEPFLISSAVDCVLAQRLARKLCPKCKEAYEPSPEIRKEFGLPLDKDITLYRAKGCNKCNNTGYRGRIGLYEHMIVSEDIERLTIERASTEEIKKVAISEGMITLQEDGLEKVVKGMTSLEEIMRVVI